MPNYRGAPRMARRELLTVAGASILAACSDPLAKIAPRTEGGSTREVLAPYVERGEVPGLVALVARGHREELLVMGTTAQGSRGAVEADTIFRITSITKPLTATAAMMLIGDGKLALDEPVARWLPELSHPKVLERIDGPLDRVVPAARAITVRDLLSCRMGAGLLFDAERYPIQKATEELLGEAMPAPAKLIAPDEWLGRFATLPLMHQPGERWMYNTSGMVLGILMARAARMPLDAILRERLFGPLGMHDTDFSVPASKLHRFTASYLADPNTGALSLYDPPEGQWARPPLHPSGGEGLVSTAPDLLRFSRFLLARGTFGGKRLLSEAAVEQMTHDVLTPENKAFGAMVPGYFDHHGWGFGMAVVTARDDQHMPPGSYGWDGGLGSTWYADPSTNTTGILLASRAWTNPSPPRMFQEFWRHVYV
ncbi:serine hydrolase domain-containing protein [Pendulispora albinea]|uniref:Beta-lactamase family protein n=1 Tax=Pendulispora albinea TaxID=2741071 RepID=A0ABZ2LV84_9BACT